MGSVQDFIKDQLIGLQPAPFHLLIPKFQWRGLVSTNYDLVIESSYSETPPPPPLQTVVPITSNRDRLDDKLRSPTNVLLLKLHGCITRTNDETIKLILTTEQYATHREGRDRLFKMVNDWGHEYPIVFVGHSLQDADVRSALLELTKLGDFRPRYYLVKPSIEEPERRLWEGKRISVLDGTLEEFLKSLDNGVPESVRTPPSPVGVDHPIAHRFAAANSMSDACRDFLEADVEFVHSSMAISGGTPQAFYKGFDLGWYGIVQHLDIRRALIDEILFDWLLVSDSERPSTVELLVIRAEAGAGKSVLLRRLAWEAGVEGELLCLYLREYGQVRYDSLRELHRLTGQRIFLFVDNAADHVNELDDLLGRARSESLPLTVISAERLNTWNTSCERLEARLTEAFQLRNLNRDDIERLVDTLEKHSSLGYLKDLPREAQVAAFVERAGRQLLVALHEATSGRPFEDILVDEYNEVRPPEAQALYLSVCVLNRLGIPVRAGIIARVHQIPFTQFRARLFSPLEHVVRVVEHPLTKDYLYTARHTAVNMETT